MSDLDVGRLTDGDADGDTGGGSQRSCLDQEHGWDFPWRWIILFSGWFSFALFSATLYTSGECQIGLFFDFTIDGASDQYGVQVSSLSFIFMNLGRHALKQPGSVFSS